MPTTEPTYGWPLPEDGDELAQGAAAMRNLAAGIAGTLDGLARPVCMAYKTADQGIDETTVELLTGWSEQINVGGFTVGSNGITVPEDGVYLIAGTAAFDGDGSSEVRTVSWLGLGPFAAESFAVDLARIMVMWKPFTNNALQGHSMTPTTLASLTAGQEVGMAAYHDYSGTSSKVLNLRGGYETQLSIVKV